jgi:hypothetical protein
LHELKQGFTESKGRVAARRSLQRNQTGTLHLLQGFVNKPVPTTRPNRPAAQSIIAISCHFSSMGDKEVLPNSTGSASRRMPVPCCCARSTNGWAWSLLSARGSSETTGGGHRSSRAGITRPSPMKTAPEIRRCRFQSQLWSERQRSPGPCVPAESLNAGVPHGSSAIPRSHS